VRNSNLTSDPLLRRSTHAAEQDVKSALCKILVKYKPNQYTELLDRVHGYIREYY